MRRVMRHALLFGLMVILIWSFVEVRTKGMDGAFGGMLARFHTSAPLDPGAHPADKAFQRAYDSDVKRVDEQLKHAE
jgi:hypothetical protein